MPWTLYRYILWEMLKLLVVATAVLLCVLSFAAAIKPLSDGLLGAAGMAKFVFYSGPTFLQFVLPFAGAFASTLVFHRMTSDNEIVACSGSGISYRSILVPVVFLGLVLTLGLFFLSNWVVPWFYQKTATLIQKDLITLMVTKVQHGETVDEIKDCVLYADRAIETDPPAALLNRDPAPDKLIILEGVAFSQRDSAGRLRYDVTAQRADALVYKLAGQTLVTMRLRNVVYHNPTDGSFSQNPQDIRVGPLVVPGVFKDDPKFLSWPKLAQSKRNPDEDHRIQRYKRKLAEALACEDAARLFYDALMRKDHNVVVLKGPLDGEQYLLTAPNAERDPSGLRLIGSEHQPVRVEYHLNGVPIRAYEATDGTVRVEATEVSPEPEIHVKLNNVRVFDLRQADPGNEHSRHRLPNNVWTAPLLAPLLSYDSRELRAIADKEPYRHARSVQAAKNMLAGSRAKLLRTIVAELHKRAASATACLFTLALGAVLSMKLRGSMPLVVYFWNFLLATLAVIITYSGVNIATDVTYLPAIGLGVIWSGCLILCIVSAMVYVKLAKH